MSHGVRSQVLSLLGAYMLSVSCAGRNVGEPPRNLTTQAPAPSIERGGRLFDNWAAELGVDFVPDDPATPALDGKGGPFGNGTLPRVDGTPMANPGHDYRLKNLFGWDLRGGEGIYGPGFLNKEHVLLPDLLRNTESREVWLKRLRDGEDAIPALGKVMGSADLEALVAFLFAVRDGSLPGPADLFTLTSKDQGHYSLVPGAEPARGHEVFAHTCARCHGAGGDKFPLGGGHSVGSLMRQKAYETWLKVLDGHPGSSMRGQLEASLERSQKAALLRDLHAAVCDRGRYPKGSEADVADGDPRCGPYLR